MRKLNIIIFPIFIFNSLVQATNSKSIKHSSQHELERFGKKITHVVEGVMKGWERVEDYIACYNNNFRELKQQHERAAVMIELAQKGKNELSSSPATQEVVHSRKKIEAILHSAVKQKRHAEAHLKELERLSRDLCNQSAAAVTKNKLTDKHITSSQKVFEDAAAAELLLMHNKKIACTLKKQSNNNAS